MSSVGFILGNMIVGADNASAGHELVFILIIIIIILIANAAVFFFCHFERKSDSRNLIQLC